MDTSQARIYRVAMTRDEAEALVMALDGRVEHMGELEFQRLTNIRANVMVEFGMVSLLPTRLSSAVKAGLNS